MKKINLCAWLMLFALLLGGCKGSQEDLIPLEDLFYRTEVAMGEGQLYFAGKVLEKTYEDREITYYESESTSNTFYKVEATDDFFGFLPERTLTVCVMGTGEHFVSRAELEKGKEYLFQVNPWAGENEIIFLLPTFYEAMPQKEGEYLYYTKGETRYAVDGGIQDYKNRIDELAKEYGYTASAVGAAIIKNLQTASERDASYFEKLKYETVDRATIDGIADFAKNKSLASAPQTAEEIKGILK